MNSDGASARNRVRSEFRLRNPDPDLANHRDIYAGRRSSVKLIEVNALLKETGMLGRTLKSAVGIILSVWTSLAGMGAAGASACTLPPMHIAERPGFGGPPTEVAIGLIVGDLLTVDDVNQQMTADLFATLEWSDPRLDSLDGCSFQRARVWTPPITLFNSAVLSTERTQARDQVSVGPDGRVRYSQRYRGEISTYHALHRFPFDRQSFTILVGSLGEGPSELLLRTLPEKSALAQRLNIEGWRITSYQVDAQVAFVPTLDADRSVFAATIDAERMPGFYMFRILLPLLFIVAMSWAVFWVPPKKYEFRLGLGATSMLTVVAFQLAMSNYLPRLGYLTKMDGLIIWATATVFLTIASTIFTGRMIIKRAGEKADRLDGAFRIAIPILFFAGWAFLLLT